MKTQFQARMGVAAAVAVALLLLAIPARAATPTYIVLAPDVEQWYRADGLKNHDLRLHSTNAILGDGRFVHTREVLRGDDPVLRRDFVFARGENGTILYHGDLDKGVSDEPIAWVDAPLVLGKTWTGSLPAFDKPGTGARIHYVFAVIEQKDITCPEGTFPCHRVFVAAVNPDGSTDICNFWYNPQCGIIRCSDELTGAFVLLKSQRIGEDAPDVDPEDPATQPEISGLSTAPNPFNPRTDLKFTLASTAPVTIVIHDVAGREVRRLLAGEIRSAGEQAVSWDGRDNAGRPAASGTYIARIRAGEAVASGVMVLVR